MTTDKQKETRRANHELYYTANREKILAYSKAYYKAHREERRIHYEAHRGEKKAYGETYRQRPGVKTRIKEYAWKYFYGLTPEAYGSMLSEQGGKCAVCSTADWGRLGPVVDHNHETGFVRGILCNRCNAAAGMMDDDQARAHALGNYLARSEK